MDNESKHVILIVEDSDEDFYTTKRAFNKSNVANKIYRCSDGDEALRYLKQTDEFQELKNAPIPNIILLDLNLPKKNGRELLKIIKKDPKLMRIPIVILTTSLDTSDVDECYGLGANSYIKKPVDLDKFMNSIKLLEDYWFEIVVLPKVER